MDILIWGFETGKSGRQQTVKLSKRPRAQPKSQTHLTATVFRHKKAEKASKFPDLALYQTRTNLSLGPAQARPWVTQKTPFIDP